MKNDTIQTRKWITTCLLALLTFCLVLTGIFFIAPIEAEAASCDESTCTGTYDQYGICTANEAHYQPAVLNGDTYEIGNYGQYMWFAGQVNSGVGVSYNARLTDSISFLKYTTYKPDGTSVKTYRAFEPIGNGSTRAYRGVFDGNGYVLDNINIDDGGAVGIGVFGYVNGATVKRLTVLESHLLGQEIVGGIVGYAIGATIEDCAYEGIVRASDIAGGIVGYAENTVIKRAYTSATVTAGTNSGGIAGQLYGTGNALSDCYYLETGAEAGFNGDVANGSAVAVGADSISGGEVAYLLNKAQRTAGATEMLWGQYIDYEIESLDEINANDLLSALSGVPLLGCQTQVYKTLSCTNIGEAVYTNDASVSENMATHLYNKNGFCRENTSHYEPATLTTDKYDLDGDGQKDQVYEIATAGNLYWFANQCNTVSSELNAILTNDIVINPGTYDEYAYDEYVPADGEDVRVWVTINEYNGIFDGNGYTISGLWQNALINTLSGVVCNLGIVNSSLFSYSEDVVIGTFANYLSGSMYGCYSEAVVTAIPPEGCEYYNVVVGGLVGEADGEISSSYNAGELFSSAKSELVDEYPSAIGGIAGRMMGGIITKSYNVGFVNGGADGYSGGIVG